MSVLKSFGDNAYDNVRTVYGREKVVNLANNNIYGKVFWYFANIFYHQKVPYAGICDIEEQIKDELAVAEKYCEFCEMVK